MTDTLTSPSLITPEDPRYHQARQAWNLTAEQRPAAVALPRSADELAAVVRAAAHAGRRVAVQGTGHNAGPLGPIEDAVLLRTTGMTGVDVDLRTRTARVAAGTVWLPVVQAAADAGLAALHGSSPDVGVAGYSLGGGTGWYARSLGLQTNSLTAVELVTADGSMVRADATSEPDLFWALRGGGGNFGAVTALEFRLYPISSAYAGMLVWDRSRNAAVLSRWLDWGAQVPDSVTTSYRVLHLPDVPELPASLRGRSVAVVDGAVLGSDEQAEAVLAPLRELGPEIDTFTRVPAPALARLHMDPEGPTPTASAASMLSLARGGTADLVDVLDGVAGADGGSTVLMGVELRQLGGALARPHPGGGALSHFDGDLIAFAGGMPPDADTARAMEAAADRVMQALTPWANGRNYLNFVERPTDVASGFDPDTWTRLRRIRAQVDPGGLFLANHRIPPQR